MITNQRAESIDGHTAAAAAATFQGRLIVWLVSLPPFLGAAKGDVFQSHDSTINTRTQHETSIDTRYRV